MKKTVLITCAGGLGYPSLVKCFNKKEFRIIGTAFNEDASGFGFVDKGYVVSGIHTKTYISDLLNVCKKGKVDVIIPVNQEELLTVSKAAKKFEGVGTKMLLSPTKSIELVSNKDKFSEWCQKNGVPTPQFIKARTAEEFKKAVLKLGYPKTPVCFKPKSSSGSKGFRILSKKNNKLDNLFKNTDSLSVDFDEVYKVLKEAKKFPELLVMEYLPGHEYSIDVVAHKGKAQVIVPRIRTKIILGASFVGHTLNDKEIIDYSRTIADGIGFEGVIGIQFKRDAKGKVKVLEVNPRVQGALLLTVAAGANVAEYAVKNVLGMPWKMPKIEWNTKFIRYYYEIYKDPSGKFFEI